MQKRRTICCPMALSTRLGGKFYILRGVGRKEASLIDYGSAAANINAWMTCLIILGFHGRLMSHEVDASRVNASSTGV